MAEERIDIVVEDSVSPEPEKKIRGIAAAADKGYSSLQKLKDALSSVNVNSLAKLQQASANNTNALARELNAQAKLTAARDKSALADAKAATEAQRLATETAKTEAAQARAAGAAMRLQAAQDRQAASAQRAADRAAALKLAEDTLQAELDASNAKFAAGVTYIERYAASLNSAAAAASKPIASAGPMPGVGQLPPNYKAGLSEATVETEKLNKAQKGMGATNANILAQFNDLGVQFAMAANSSKPLQGVFMALIQQGSQLAYIASVTEGGWRGITAQAGALLLKFAPLIVVLGALYAGFNSLASSVNEANPSLAKMGEEAGLTRDELKKLGDTSVTTTDVIQAAFEVLGENILSAMGVTTDEIKTAFSDAGNWILNVMKAAFVGIAGFARVLVQSFLVMGRNIATIFYNAGVGAANLFLMGIEKLYNGTVGIINKLSPYFNAVFGTSIKPIAEMSTGVKGLTSGMRELEGFDPLGEFQKGARNSLDAINRIGNRAADIRRKANQSKIDEIKKDRTPKAAPKGSNPKTREDYLDDTNKKLDDELARMGMLKQAREEQSRLDQIEQEFMRRRQPLTATEIAGFKAKIHAIEEFKYVQQEMDRIYEDAQGPLRTYNAVIAASNKLLREHNISSEDASRAQVGAARAFAEATDPLFRMKEAMTSAEIASRQFGLAAQQGAYYEQLRQAYLAKNIELSPQYVAGVNSEVDALMRRNAELQKQNSLKTTIDSTVSGITNPLIEEQNMISGKADMYAEIDRMRQADLLSEANAARAKYALDAKFSEMRLQGASSFFGQLAGLASSGNKKLAAIGKAAAVVQATIDGYVAVQKALASAPPPWNFALAAAVAVKTGAQVAGIMSTNAGSFATGGQFMVEGRSGVDANNINMNVTRGERVTIETPAQQRANDASNGKANVQVAGPKIVNLFDEKSFIGAMDSEHGEEVIMNIIRRRTNDTKQILGVS